MRLSRISALLLSTTALAIALPSSLVLAAESADAGLEEIVVTAQKREEKLQDVPVAVTAFSASQIEKAGISNPQDFLVLTPNVFMAQSFTVGNSFVTIRGVSQINNGDPSVAVVVDGVPQSNQKQLTEELFDVERIEVLKGPQGALYGRNAIGGAINIITKQPGNEFDGFAKAGYGNGNSVALSAGIGGPILKDKILFRLAGSYKDSDGLIKNVYLDKKVDFYKDKNVRAQLKFLPVENLTLDLRGHYSKTDGGAVLYSTFPTNADSNATQYRPDENVLGHSDREVKDATAKLDYVTDFATVTGIFGYTKLTESYRGDLDFTNPTRYDATTLIPIPGLLGLGQGQDLNLKTRSYELRLTSPNSQAFRWIAGAYLLNTDRTLVTTGFLDFTGNAADLIPAFSGGKSIDKNRAYAFFGQAEYDVTPKLTIQGALRYDSDRRHQLNNDSSSDTYNTLREHTFNRVQPKATVKYKWTDDVMTYATVSTGFRSGGYNSPNSAITSRGIGMFNQENSTNYEIGFKSTMLDRHLIINGDAFYQRLKNYQFFSVDIATASQIIQNIDRVDMKGLELEFQALPVKGLDIFGGLGVTDSVIKSYALQPAWVNNKSPSTPEYTANLGVQFTQPVTDMINMVARVDYRHEGKKYWHADNVAYQKPIDLVNARLGFETDHYSIAGWIKNMFNRQYFVEYAAANFSGLFTGNDIGQLAPQRTFGVEGKVKF
jgi:iron complex outermembrane receptor protein